MWSKDRRGTSGRWLISCPKTRSTTARRRSAGRVGEVEQGRVKLAARRDSELREDPTQVVRDRPVRDVELLADLMVGQAFRGHLGNLELLTGQLVPRLGHPATAGH